MNNLALLFLLSFKAISCLSHADLFFLSDQKLFQMGIDQFQLGFKNQLGYCYISNDPHFCTHYAGVRFPNGTVTGLPDLYGTGCLNGCWGSPNTYYNYENTKIPICTGNVVTDGANMMRIGLIKGYCGPQNVSSSTASTTESATTIQEKQSVKQSIQTIPLKLFFAAWISILVLLVIIVILLCEYLSRQPKGQHGFQRSVYSEKISNPITIRQ